MSKSTHFFGQPVYGQLIKSLDRAKIVEMSRKNGGERYVKNFDGYVHLLTMLSADPKKGRFLRNSLRCSVHCYLRRLTERVADDDALALLGCFAFFTFVAFGLAARLARDDDA